MLTIVYVVMRNCCSLQLLVDGGCVFSEFGFHI